MLIFIFENFLHFEPLKKWSSESNFYLTRLLPCLVRPWVNQCSLSTFVKLIKIDSLISPLLKLWNCQNWSMDFSMLLHGLVQIYTWISLTCFTWICQNWYLYFSNYLLLNKCTRVCQKWYMDFSKLLPSFVNIDT